MPRAVPSLIAVTMLAWTAAGAPAQNIRVEHIATAGRPTALAAAPGQPNRLYVAEQNGWIRILDLNTGTLTPPAGYLDLSTSAGGMHLTFPVLERGLSGLVFHPDFLTNGQFFVYYVDLNGNSVLARFTANQPYATSTSASTSSFTIIRQFDQDGENHYAGDMHFGPDGMLYLSIGDGQNPNDPNEHAQDPLSYMGKILRFDVDNPASDYIPTDNPFVGDPDYLPEIWALGLRNPFRFCFDRLTGDMYIGDVGQDDREELDFQPALLPDHSNYSEVAGRNYGWDCREGSIPSPATDDNCSRAADFIEPIADFAHPDACAITGGRVYRGAAIPELDGVYFFADFCDNWVKSVRMVDGAPTDLRDLSEIFGSPARDSIVGFTEDAAGELYMVSLFSGRISKIVPNNGPCGCPCLLTGEEGLVFEDTFAADVGWTISGAATGAWTRAAPQNDPGYPFDPVTDADSLNAPCLITGNIPASTDVDGGDTIATSAPLDLSIGGITICYAYFLDMGFPSGGDGIRLEISSNGTIGPWTVIASHTTSNGLAWTRHAITQADLDLAGITLTANMRLRFIATDTAPDSTVEAGIDNVRIYSANIPDCNGNGADDALDISTGFSLDCNGNQIPDECDIEALVEADLAGGPVGVWSAGKARFNTSCVGCHNVNGLGATGPRLRNVSRSTIRARLTFQVFHPGGAFPSLTAQDYADIEAFLADGSSRARPDGIPDACQLGLLADCDGDTIPDGAELSTGSQHDLDYDGIPDTCEPFCAGDVTGDLRVTTADFVILASHFNGTYPLRRSDGDLTGDGKVNTKDFNQLANDFACIAGAP